MYATFNINGQILKVNFSQHVGGDSVHVPSELHKLIAFPLRSYPDEHVKVALVRVPDVVSVTLPLSGSFKG